jgi:two-component system response regulator YesN
MNDLKVDEIAKIFGFERSYLFRIFKAKYGIGLKEYIVKVRTDWAKKFLADGYSVVDTSFMVGYRDEFNFSRGFKKFVGVSPMEYKKKYKK